MANQHYGNPSVPERSSAMGATTGVGAVARPSLNMKAGFSANLPGRKSRGFNPAGAKKAKIYADSTC